MNLDILPSNLVNVILYQCQRFKIKGLWVTAWKLFKYGVFSGPYFPAFGLNTKMYVVNLRIQSKYGKIRTRKNSVFRQFLCNESLTIFMQWVFNKDWRWESQTSQLMLRSPFVMWNQLPILVQCNIFNVPCSNVQVFWRFQGL